MNKYYLIAILLILKTFHLYSKEDSLARRELDVVAHFTKEIHQISNKELEKYSKEVNLKSYERIVEFDDMLMRRSSLLSLVLAIITIISAYTIFNQIKSIKELKREVELVTSERKDYEEVKKGLKALKQEIKEIDYSTRYTFMSLHETIMPICDEICSTQKCSPDTAKREQFIYYGYRMAENGALINLYKALRPKIDIQKVDAAITGLLEEEIGTNASIDQVAYARELLEKDMFEERFTDDQDSVREVIGKLTSLLRLLKERA